MILSLGQVCSRATEMAGGRVDWRLSDASFYANMAAQQVSQFAGHLPKEAIGVSSTTSGEKRYAVPSDFDYAVALTLHQGSGSTDTSSSRATIAIPLKGRDANWADGRDFPDDGVPEFYVTYATWLEVYPSPNSAYSMQLRYIAKAPTLVDSAETLLLDDRWHPAWLFKTVELLEASRNNVEGEAMARNRYLNYITTIPTDTQLKQRDRNAMVLRYIRNKWNKDS